MTRWRSQAGLSWTEIKSTMESEDGLNKQYDADLDGVVDYAKDVDTVDGMHASDFAQAATYVDKSNVFPDSSTPLTNDTGRPVIVFYSGKITAGAADGRW